MMTLPLRATLAPAVLALGLAPGCIIFESPNPDDSDPDTNPIEQDCDLDGDGLDDVACGGEDCDDGDATIYAGAPEIYDEVDQDCDGDPWVHLAVVDVPPSTTPRGWRWNDDLRKLGGVVITDSGGLAGHTITLGDPFGSPMVAQNRALYDGGGILLGTPRRVWFDGAPVDVFGTYSEEGATLQAWDADGTLFATALEADVLGDVDGWIDGDVMHVVGCGGGAVRYVDTDLTKGAAIFETELASDVDTCALVAPAGAPLVLTATSTGGPITRYRVTEAGLGSYLVIASWAEPHFLRTATRGDNALIGFDTPSAVTLLSGDGAGRVLPNSAGTSRLALDVGQRGGVAVAWVAGDGVLRIGLGAFNGLVIREIDLGVDVVALSVGLSPTELAVSAFDGQDLHLIRAVRPPL